LAAIYDTHISRQLKQLKVENSLEIAVLKLVT